MAKALNCIFAALIKQRRGVRVAEGARLESVYRGNSIAGSNPALSAEMFLKTITSKDLRVLITFLGHKEGQIFSNYRPHAVLNAE